MRSALRGWLLAAACLLAGCGMYGSLYLEEGEGPAPTPEVTELPSVADDEDDDEAPRRP